MAFDVLKPATTDNYVTQFTQGIRANILALAMGLDSVQSTFTGTIPTYTKRWNRSTGVWEEYNGTSWVAMQLGYVTTAGNITGKQFIATPAAAGLGGQVILQTIAGVNGPYLGVDSSSQVALVNTANTSMVFATNNSYRLYLDASGYLYPANSLVQDLGKSTNRWGVVYARDVQIQSRLQFYGGSGLGFIEANDGNWGLNYKPASDGATGSHLWVSANGTYLAHMKLVGGLGLFDVDTVTSRTLNVATKLTLPNFANNTSHAYFVAGTGDGASYTTQNVLMRTWWGFGIEDYSGVVHGYYDARTGVWDTHGGFKHNGVLLPNINGSNATGTWPISITGNAATASTVTTVGATQVGNAIIALGVYDLGSHMLAKNFTGSAKGVGATVSGASLQAGDGGGGSSGSTMPGTWRLNGWCGSLGVSLWTRVA